MSLKFPSDLLLECGSCGIENLLAGFTPATPAICNQCRENILAGDLAQTHQGHTCDSCGMIFLIKAEANFLDGESECQCGSQSFTELDIKDFEGVISQAQPSVSDEDEEDLDFDWCRAAPDQSHSEDYNDIFDDDPGM